MKYLILGSSGQVGEGLSEYVKSIGEEVIPFDIVNSKDEDLRDISNGKLEKAMLESDFVFFLAFDVGGSRYLKKYQETYDFVMNNKKIMVNTFETLKKTGKPFIFASSQMSTMSFSTYGLLKHIGEKTAHIIGGHVVKFWNVYGFERDLEKSHVITDLILKAHKEKKISLLTDGKEERQFLHSEDCSKALITIAKNYKKISHDQPLHITSFTWTSVLEVAKHISEAFGHIPIIPSEAHDDVQHAVKNDPSPFIRQYWQPEIDIKQGINDIIKKMKKHGQIK